jgi:hypothetical protein
MVIWYTFPVLVFCTKKNLATLLVLSPLRVFSLFYLFKYLSSGNRLEKGAILQDLIKPEEKSSTREIAFSTWLLTLGSHRVEVGRV